MFLGYVALALTGFVVAGVTAAGALALVRRWNLVVKIARITAVASGSVMLILAFPIEGAVLLIIPETFDGPNLKARVVAVSISMIVNWAAGLSAVLLWRFESWRGRVR